jgi:hypothetical protein
VVLHGIMMVEAFKPQTGAYLGVSGGYVGPHAAGIGMTADALTTLPQTTFGCLFGPVLLTGLYCVVTQPSTHA